MIVLDNGLVRLEIREDGILQELSLRGGPNLASSGYWNSSGNGYDATGSPVAQEFSVLTSQAKVMRQSDELVEVAFVRDPAGPFLFRTVLHYVLRRGDSGILSSWSMEFCTISWTWVRSCSESPRSSNRLAG